MVERKRRLTYMRVWCIKHTARITVAHATDCEMSVHRRLSLNSTDIQDHELCNKQAVPSCCSGRQFRFQHADPQQSKFGASRARAGECGGRPGKWRLSRTGWYTARRDSARGAGSTQFVCLLVSLSQRVSALCKSSCSPFDLFELTAAIPGSSSASILQLLLLSTTPLNKQDGRESR